MFQRLLTRTLQTAAARMPVVTLIGPRQSGKTTLVRHASPKHAYVSLEQPDLRNEAREDPRAFLSRFSRDAILDEVQGVPDLLSYIQVAVDSEDHPGRYILTGSQNFLLMETALRIASLIILLPPHHVNFSKRLRRRPKLHFLDTGLVCYLLGIRDAATLERHPLRGAIFESFIVGELVKSFEHTGTRPGYSSMGVRRPASARASPSSRGS